jgi:hypothetical protein
LLQLCAAPGQDTAQLAHLRACPQLEIAEHDSA